MSLKWGVTEAVREFFQNAIDEQRRDSENSMFFDYDPKGQVIRIGNRHSDLDIKTLLFGESTKRGKEEMIGSHGEGYKIATVVLLRTGKQVSFQNYCRREIWKPRLVKSRRYGGAMVPTFFVETEAVWKKVPENSLIIEISGITPEEYAQIKESNLHLQESVKRRETSRGAVLDEDKYKGKIFVGGLYICTEPRLEMGVDLKPNLVHLERDRSIVRSIDVQMLVSYMIEELKDAELTKKSLGSFAGEYILSNNVDKGIKNEIAADFVREHGEKAVPVSNQADAEYFRKMNYKPVIVSAAESEIIKNSEVYRNVRSENEESVDTIPVYDRLRAFAEKIEIKLTEEERGGIIQYRRSDRRIIEIGGKKNMKLTEFYSKPIKDVMETMEMVDLKVHTDNAGNVHSIEVKFSNDSEEIDERKRKRNEHETIF